MGQIASITDNNNNIEQHSYDYLSRLVSRKMNNVIKESFTYDSNNNILSRTNGNNTYTYTYQNDRLISISKNNNLYRSISYNPSNIYYPSSMTIKGNNESLTWSGKRLTNIGNNILYRYNEQGIRVYKQVDDVITQYQLEGNLILSMDKTTSNITHHIDFHYDSSNQLVSLTYNNQEYFYIRNVLGTILGIIDASGNLITRYTYSSYGEPIITILANTGDDLFIASNNPFLYKGYYYDDESNLYYLISRYYDPEIGRFISPDSINYLDPESISGLNLYAYCGGDPVNYCDTTGNGAVLAIILFGGFAIGFGLSLLSNAASNRWQLDYRDLLQAFVDGVFAAGSIAISMTGIGFWASVGIGAVLGWSQYALDSFIQEEKITIEGSMLSLAIGAIGGALSGAGANNTANISGSMTLTGKGASAVKAITTASNRYIAGELSLRGFKSTINLWGKTALTYVNSAIYPTINELIFRGVAKSIGITAATDLLNYILAIIN